MIYWFTGQPGYGKTTLANLVISKLEQTLQQKVFHVDGDDLRDLTLNKDYSKAGRLDNVRGAQKIAQYLHNQGHTVVVSLVSPYLSQREELKTMLGEGIQEFYITCSQVRGRESFHVEDYEPPVDNFVLIDTTEDTEGESLNKILEHIK